MAIIRINGTKPTIVTLNSLLNGIEFTFSFLSTSKYISILVSAVGKLVRVPWFAVDMSLYNDSAESFDDVSDGDGAEIKEKLEALGYGE